MTCALRARAHEIIHSHLCRAYPEEGCGVLLGRDADGTRVVERAIPLENTQGETRERRYLLAPEQILAAEREARSAGLDVVGFFHSHPDHPAIPSAFDREHAWPFYTYLIASVRGGAVADAQAWRLAEDRASFEPEHMIVLADGAAVLPPGERR